MKVKASELPTTPVDLYVKLYCEVQENFDEDSVVIARKSWLSLKKKRKNQFIEAVRLRKYATDAEQLKFLKPFLKENKHKNASLKNPIQNKTNNITLDETRDIHSETLPNNIITTRTIENVETISNENTNNEIPPITSLQNDETTSTIEHVETISNENANNEIPPNTSLQNDVDMESGSVHQIADDASVHMTEAAQSPEPNQLETNTLTENQILEPIPPCAKSAKELFLLLNKNTTQKYKDLLPVDKRMYLNAIRKIRSKYITDYKNYLENLTDEKLQEHYEKVSPGTKVN